MVAVASLSKRVNEKLTLELQWDVFHSLQPLLKSIVEELNKINTLYQEEMKKMLYFEVRIKAFSLVYRPVRKVSSFLP